MVERWSKIKNITPEQLSTEIDISFEVLKEITDSALAKTVQKGEALIRSKTPVRTGNLRNSWVSEKLDKGTYITGNDAKDPKTGFTYATTVELGLKRQAGPAYMVQSSIDQIVDILKEEISKVN